MPGHSQIIHSMKQIFRFIPLIFTLFILSCNNKNSNPQEQEQAQLQVNDYAPKLDSLIQTTRPRTFNGVILITQNGETKYSKAYGHAHFKDRTPISLKDNFRIQSNSKQVTAVLLLKEVENGKIDLKSTIRKYLPDFKQTWADTVTVHQLLNMSSGIRSIDKPLLFEPGTAYKYSNAAYGLLGSIIERVTGKTYIELANNLFKSLAMTNTYCYEIGKTNQGLISGYEVASDQFKLVDFNARGITQEGWKAFIPAGGIISNAQDLNIWDTKLHTGKILKPTSYQLMINYNNTGQHDAFGDEKIGYGYGLRIYDKKPLKKHIGHAGRGIGFASIKFYVPEKNLDVIVLENVYNEDASIVYHFEKEIRKIVLNSSLVK